MEHRTQNSKISTKKQGLKKINIPMIVISIINLIFTILLVTSVISLHIVPTKFVVIATVILFIFDILVLFLIKQRQMVFKIIGYVITGVLLLISIIGMYYIDKTNKFLNNSFDNASNTYTSTYYVVTLAGSDYIDIEGLQADKVGYYKNVPNIDAALTELEKTLEMDRIQISDLYSLFTSLDKKKVAAIVIEKSLYNFVFESTDTLERERYNVLYSFDMIFEEEIEEIDNAGDTFSIYIGGADFTEMYNDFNMIVTVNTKTHKILLTSTPRDFYVPVNGKGGMKDLLGYAGVWGINTSRKTLEDLYGVNIDYYVKINTKSLVGLVDTIGGIQFCSDFSYYTTHATVMGTYDDTKGKKLYVGKGCRNYNGIQILTIARERLAYADGDRQRQKNCQDIMISIFNELVRVENLTNYANILNAVSDLYTTNIPRELVTEFANNTLDKGIRWTFEQQSVTGRDSRGYVHFSNVQDYVMVPDVDSVDAATQKIKDIEEGK